jgi:hypothetical protein
VPAGLGWRVEPGQYTLLVGTDVERILLTAAIDIPPQAVAAIHQAT